MNTTKKIQKSVSYTAHYLPEGGALVALTYFTCFEFGGTCDSCMSS
jgi:hypothetical protein